MRYISSAIIVVLNNVQFDNIEYFAKTKQNSCVMECTHTLACVVMKGLNAYISLRGDEGVKCIH